ncbi:MAG: hypothetical protein ACPIOQ_42390, partial [Promethearchaeia archaeon]
MKPAMSRFPPIRFPPTPALRASELQQDLLDEAPSQGWTTMTSEGSAAEGLDTQRLAGFGGQTAAGDVER